MDDAEVSTEEVDAAIAANVRAIRARRQERQEDLAAELGWSRPVVGDLENGRRRVTVADAIALCRVLDVDLRELLQGVDDDDLGVLGLDRRRT
ncbi:MULTISPECIES: helix-turn-helix domain-containing protein [unclassified Kribbella]|uniref:helix-turn-helix domain-containing protein n=1 Tax=unclassified Kribbella TaxID=2644121 RepID=UPI003076D75B